MDILHIDHGTQVRVLPSVVTIGNFDGVHIGHQQLLKRAVELANQKGIRASVMTFSPHPRQVLGHGTQYDHSLTPRSQKLSLFSSMGIDYVFLISFTKEFANVPAEQFVKSFIFENEIQHVIVGFDFTFGPGGKANAQMLKEMCAPRNIPVEILPPVNLYGEKVSSSLVREKLQYGDIRLVRELLGRPYMISGKVVHGEGRGRTIGFPTANIVLEDKYVEPRTGVYAVKVEYDGAIHNGVMNIGFKPTFVQNSKQLSLEVHLFDFQEDLYDISIEVYFIDFIRPEQRFSSADELICQIGKDCKAALVALEEQDFL
ncbi:bifunctional riboflavin kinase/FAD synthetase [Fodinisporobacter ferrooxydans]|uniref:Riboflavin biosynthesis protein n=1 Tax=Fodinisporobacter ferrooxydans TaxID=2901836 RepID=A0ABY4CFU7_9BACL|nr:bifunctional riboflavin kinase/FAD synthetase [Alicyclobacillaceae bacterium MYW30-H2]